MGNFNFGSIAKVSTETSGNYLRPYNVYKNVKFAGVSEPLTGNTKDGGTWKAWDFTFEAPEGIYNERIFEPTEKSQTRAKVTNANGHETELPSEFERTLYFAAQVVEAFRPEKAEAFKKQCEKITTFDDFIKCLKTVLSNPSKTAELLLTGRTYEGSVYAKLPNFVRIGKDGNPYTSEKFVGENLALSSYELQKKKEYESAKPTNMDTVAPTASGAKGSEDMDYDSLL